MGVLPITGQVATHIALDSGGWKIRQPYMSRAVTDKTSLRMDVEPNLLGAVCRLGTMRETVPTLSNAEPGKLEGWVVKRSSWLALGIIAAAFALRLAYSASCYLNADEAQHFVAARPGSWLGAYEASHRLAHPPLLILVLHGILFFGRTELILRSPSLVGGTAALWLAFAWIRRSLGEIPALAGLLFLALSPAAISASTEVRQYGLLLCFVCGSLYATERAVIGRSTKWAIAQGLFLLGALLTHYTAPVVLSSLGVYLFVRCLLDGVPRRILFTVGASHLVLATALGWLYFDHVRRSPVFTGLNYLSQFYYVQGSETPLGFLRRALFGTFSYMVSGRLAFLSMLVFVAGFVALLSGRTKARRLMAVLVMSPFAVGFTAAFCHALPFAGSRHQTYLLPFVAAGFSAAVAWMRRSLAAPLLLLGVALAPLWVARTAPDNNPRILPIGDMTAAAHYLVRTIPHGAPLFVDGQTHPVLRYYLGRNDPSLGSLRYDPSGERIGGYLVVPPRRYVWAFSPKEVLAQVNDSAQALGVPPRDPLWIVSAAWTDPPLASRLPAGGRRDGKEFGRISVIKIPQEISHSGTALPQLKMESSPVKIATAERTHDQRAPRKDLPFCRHLIDRVPVSALCEEHRLRPTAFYR